MSPVRSRILKRFYPRLQHLILSRWQGKRRRLPEIILEIRSYIFTPLYIANYCQNYCIYCGFNCYNNIRRKKLTFEEIEHEMQVIARTGMEEILILTGESRAYSDVKYIGEAVKIAKKYFKNIGIEIYPVNVDEYQYLHECGVDYVTVFQETYHTDKYETLHLYGT